MQPNLGKGTWHDRLGWIPSVSLLCPLRLTLRRELEDNDTATQKCHNWETQCWKVITCRPKMLVPLFSISTPTGWFRCIFHDESLLRYVKFVLGRKKCWKKISVSVETRTLKALKFWGGKVWPYNTEFLTVKAKTPFWGMLYLFLGVKL